MKSTLLLLAALFLLSTHFSYAGSATWNEHPPNFYWHIADDWVEKTVPNGPDDVATFRASNKTTVLVAGQKEVNRVVFGSDASTFSINGDLSSLLVFSGLGVVNDSAFTQGFITNAIFAFINTASAGERTVFGTILGGAIQFSNDSTAGSSTCTARSGGSTLFFDNSTAGTGTIINYSYGSTHFYDDSTAGDGTFTNASGNGDHLEDSGSMAFHGNSTAGNGTFINEAGTFGADGGLIEFYNNSTAGAGAFTNENGGNSTQNSKISF